MGFDFNGGMGVGANAGDIIEQLGLDEGYVWKFIGKHCLSTWSPYYEAPMEEWLIGYPVYSINVCDIDLEWLNKIKALGAEFEKLTKTKAILFGSQDIT